MDNTIFDIGFYPNPTSDEGTLYFSLKEDNSLKVSVYNSTGQMASEKRNVNCNVGLNKIHITTKGFSSGVYFVKVETNEGHWFIPIMINK